MNKSCLGFDKVYAKKKLLLLLRIVKDKLKLAALNSLSKGNQVDVDWSNNDYKKQH